MYKNNLSEIDLSPLEEMSHLHRLYLRFNKLCRLNLEALNNCRELKYIDLINFDLGEIDLRPLSQCERIIVYEGTKVILPEGNAKVEAALQLVQRQ